MGVKDFELRCFFVRDERGEMGTFCDTLLMIWGKEGNGIDSDSEIGYGGLYFG